MVHEFQNGLCVRCGCPEKALHTSGWECKGVPELGPSQHGQAAEKSRPPTWTAPKVALLLITLGILIGGLAEFLPKLRKSVASADGIELLPTKAEVDKILAEQPNDPFLNGVSDMNPRSTTGRNVQANMFAWRQSEIINRKIESKTRHLSFGTNLEILGETDDGRATGDKGDARMKLVRVLDGKHKGKEGRVADIPEFFADERSAALREEDLAKEAAEHEAEKQRWIAERASQEKAAAEERKREKAAEERREREIAEMEAERAMRQQVEFEAEQQRQRINQDIAKAEAIFWAENNSPSAKGRPLEEIAASFTHRGEVLAALKVTAARKAEGDAAYYARNPQAREWEKEKQRRLAEDREAKMQKEVEYQEYRAKHPKENLPQHSYVTPEEFAEWLKSRKNDAPPKPRILKTPSVGTEQQIIPRAKPIQRGDASPSPVPDPTPTPSPIKEIGKDLGRSFKKSFRIGDKTLEDNFPTKK